MTSPHIARLYSTLNAWGTNTGRSGDGRRCAFGHIYYRPMAPHTNSTSSTDFSELFAQSAGGDFYARSMADMFDDFKDIYQPPRRESVLSIRDLDEAREEVVEERLVIEEVVDGKTGEEDEVEDVAITPASNTNTPSGSATSCSCTSPGVTSEVDVSVISHTASELSLLRVLEELRQRMAATAADSVGDAGEDRADNTNAKPLQRSVTNILSLAGNVPDDSMTQSFWTNLQRLFMYQAHTNGKPLRHFQLLQDFPEQSEDTVVDNTKSELSADVSETNSSESVGSIQFHNLGLSHVESSTTTLGKSFESIRFTVSDKAILAEHFGKKEIKASRLFQNNGYTTSATDSSFSVDAATSTEVLYARRPPPSIGYARSRILRGSLAATVLYVGYLLHIHIVIAFLMDVFLTDDQMTVVGVALPVMVVTLLAYFTLFYNL